jgi:CxxC motif-containing protein (DUF1111 family)
MSNQTMIRRLGSLAFACTLLLGAPSAASEDFAARGAHDPEDISLSAETLHSVPLGAPLPGLTAMELDLFNAGKATFERDFTIAEGRGPLFNGPACVTCHFGPVTGGSEFGTEFNVRHMTIVHDRQTHLAWEFGGPVRQEESIAGESGAGACTMPPEPDIPAPEGHISPRHTPPVFGFGLLDAVPDKTILERQGFGGGKRRGVGGVANFGVELEGLVRLQGFAFDITRKQPAGAHRVGRFGWHAPTATLFQFSTEPFNIELGVSTPFFPREFTNNGEQPPPECFVANAQPNDVQSQNSIKLFHFQALLAAPAPAELTRDAKKGEKLFKQIGCTDCHRESMTTMKNYSMPLADGSAHRVAALSNKKIFPYSDLLIHDMGPGLADHRPQGRASGRFWRTTPLWGFRHKTHYLHDGRTTSEFDAIVAHGGEGQSSTDAFLDLSPRDQERVIEFLESQ